MLLPIAPMHSMPHVELHTCVSMNMEMIVCSCTHVPLFVPSLCVFMSACRRAYQTCIRTYVEIHAAQAGFGTHVLPNNSNDATKWSTVAALRSRNCSTCGSLL